MPSPTGPRPSGGALLLLAAGIVLIAANLRPAVTSIAALLPEIRLDLGLSSAAASLLTAAPVLCFGLLAPLAPRLADRLGMERTLGLALAVLAGGLLIRVGPSAGTLFAGTIVAGGAIAIANVLLPALIKRDFPSRAGAITGAYTTALQIAAAAAAGLSVPIAATFGGWRSGAAFWAIPALITLLLWLPQLRARTRPPEEAALMSLGGLLRDPLAWQVTLYFGIQSLEFYAVVSWLPTIYGDAGFAASDAALLLSLLTLIGAPAALVTPSLATRAHDQRLIALIVGLITATGLAGILLAPTSVPVLWVCLVGIGFGASFPLALTLLVLRTRTAVDAGRLSAMSQSIGYLIAATGPFALGTLHDLTGAWTVPLAFILSLLVPQTLLGIAAGRRRFVGA